MTLVHVDYDLIALIISHLDPAENTRTARTLANLCLCIKTTLALAQPQLYRTVRIDDMRHELVRHTSLFMKALGSNPSNTAQSPSFKRTMDRDSEYRFAQRVWARASGLPPPSNPRSTFWSEQLEVFDDSFVDVTDYDLDQFEQTESDDAGIYPFSPIHWGPSDIVDPFSYRQLNALIRFPHLRQYVKTIDFGGRIEGKTSARIIQHFLNLCPNVNEVRLVRGKVFEYRSKIEAMESFIVKAPNLVSLEVTDFTFLHDQAHHVLERVAKLPNLVHLSLTCQNVECRYSSKLDFDDFEPFPQRFQTLHFGSPLSMKLLNTIIASSHSSLTSLGIAIYNSKLYDLRELPNLKELCITYDDPAFVAQMLKVLPRSIQIEHLELRYCKRLQMQNNSDDNSESSGLPSNDDEDSLDEEEGPINSLKVRRKRHASAARQRSWGYILKKIPSSVRHLSIPFYLERADKIEFSNALAKAKNLNLVTLSILEVPAKYGGDGDEDELEGGYVDDDELDRLDELEHWNTTRRITERRGIELYPRSEWMEEILERSFVNRMFLAQLDG